MLSAFDMAVILTGALVASGAMLHACAKLMTAKITSRKRPGPTRAS